MHMPCALSKGTQANTRYLRYYDFSIDWLDTPAGKDKFDEMDRDIRRLKCFHSSRPHGEEADSEDIYGELEYSEEDGFALPQVEAAKNSVMLSYGWGKMVDGSFPSQRRVLQLSQKLQDHGFKVWLDLDHMMGEISRAALAIAARPFPIA